MKKIYSILILLFLSVSIYAQKGKVVGQIVDGETGEEMIGAAVMVVGSSVGAVTDLNGNYSLSLDPGTYSLSFSYVSYTSKIVENVEVKAGQVAKIDIALSSDIELEEIVVSAEAIQDNDVALLKVQKKALSVQDGISAMEIKKTGASNAAESMTQVTGASVEGGKYVVMRGLGDRYSLTQMNNVTMPSADPYRNSTSMDLIPSEMIDNVTTLKTFTPDKPGNFTGGIANITTKSLPQSFYLNVGFSAEYNTQSSMRSGFLVDPAANNRGSGFDDGTRAKPTVFDSHKNLLSLSNTESLVERAYDPDNAFERNLLDKSVKSLDNGFLPEVKKSSINHGANIAFGNSYKVANRPLGFNLGMTYNRDYLHLTNKKTGIYSDGGAEKLIREQALAYTESGESANIGGLFSLSYQLSANNEITLNTIYNHIGESELDIAAGSWRNSAAPFYGKQSIKFKERSLLSNQLSGKHIIQGLRKTSIEWNVGSIKLLQDEPDFRGFGYVINNGVYVMNKSEVGRLPFHFYRNLKDEQINGQLDITVPLSDKNESMIKFGGLYSKTDRTFKENQYSQWKEPIKPQPGVNDNYVSFVDANGDLPSYFAPSNYGVISGPAENTSSGKVEYGIGNYFTDLTILGNNYTGEQMISAAYLMGVYDFMSKLKVIAGARVETTRMSTNSADTTKRNFGKVDGDGNPILETRNGILEATDLLPSLNLIYKLNEKTNIRLAASKTIARPNMREISPFSSTSTPEQPIVTGNKDLKRTRVQNLDLRIESYPSSGELLAFSAYYKNFTDPIVWLLVPTGSISEITPINVDKAAVYGVEGEFRKNLDFISPALEGLKLGFNVSYIYSRSDKSATELNALRQLNRPGIKSWRPMQGQSPYIVNGILNYFNSKLNWDNTLTYNIWGKRLSFVTFAADPDVYEMPRNSLNFVSRKKINNSFSLSFKAKNILNMNYLKKFDRSGSNYVYESYYDGTSLSLAVSYSL